MDLQSRNGMVVQVIRPPQGGMGARQIVSDTGGTRYYVQPAQTQARSISLASPAQRLTATNRLGNIYATSPNMHQYSMKRPFTSDYALEYSIRNKYPRSVDKNRGLRHFSTKVCEKVKEKGQTNYNEVADELVAEYFDSLPNPPTSVEKQQYDMKNIRRRVYDALNVLMAMNIIEKEKKEIRWVGLPTSSLQECRRLEDEKSKRQERIRHKTEQLQELIIQLVAYKSLVQRNREREREEGRPADSAILYLPYIIVNTDRRTNVDCAISADKTEYLFNFDQPFEIHDDIEVLKRLGLSYGLEKGQVDPVHHDAIRRCLPNALREYANQIIEGNLCGGVVSQAAKGPQTVTIPIGQTGQKGALRMAPLNSPAIGRTPTGGIPVPRMGQAPARYAVVPRPVAGTSRYGGAVQSPMYRTPGGSAPTVKYVTQSQSVPGPSRIQGQSYAIQRTSYNVGHPQPIYSQQIHQEGVPHHYVEEEIYEDEDENLQYE